jgi:ribose-phosphate pyrophosphokinase
MIRIQTQDDHVGIIPSIITFPGGERHVKLCDDLGEPVGKFLQKCSTGHYVNISLDFENCVDLIDLLLVVNALRHMYRHYNVYFNLTVPYMPFARQDRIANDGEAHGVMVASQIINSCNFNSIEIWDPHSDITRALFPVDKLAVREQYEIVANMLFEPQRLDVPNPLGIDIEKAILVCPDAGALKKIYKCSERMNGLPVVRADKMRDTKTGQITGTTIVNPKDIEYGKDLIIIDDICDGGRTFIDLAKELKAHMINQKANRIFLYVTHGIFSKGLEVFRGLIDGVICPNVINNDHLFKDGYADLSE